MHTIVIILIVIAALFFLPKPLRVFLTVVLGFIYVPINAFQTMVQKWYFSLKHKDIVMYYLFTPFYWIVVAITFIISIPYEFLIATDLH